MAVRTISAPAFANAACAGRRVDGEVSRSWEDQSGVASSKEIEKWSARVVPRPPSRRWIGQGLWSLGSTIFSSYKEE